MKKSRSLKVIAVILSCLLIYQQTGFAQVVSVELDIAGRFASFHNTLSADKFRPLHLRSISYDGLNNNFKLLLDKGDTGNLKTQDLELTAKDLLNYFFVGIALPNSAFKVNLRPDSPNDIIDPLLAQTDVGKILLEADLQLKKDTANATNPQTPQGREYWNLLYQKAGEIYGNQNVTIPTLTRPWIVPDEIIIRESTDSAYVYKATLKVMLEQDYLKDNAMYSFKDEREKQLNEYSSKIIRENIIPKLTKEINSARRYAPLRQVYYSLILAQWFKARNHGNNNLYSGRINKKDLTGLRAKTAYSVDAYFNAYKENFAKGEYNIKEPISTPYGQVVRSYFSGGIADIAPLIPELGEVSSKSAVVTVVPDIKDSGVDLNTQFLRETSENADGEVRLEVASLGQSSKGPAEIREVIVNQAGNEAEGKQDLADSVEIKTAVQVKHDDPVRNNAIKRIIARINDYNAFERQIGKIINKLKAGEIIPDQEVGVLNEIKNRLILKNSLVAMQLKVHQGDILVVNNQAAIKFLNTIIGEPQTDNFIELRQKIVTRLLLEKELISSEDLNTLSLLFKQDKFVIETDVVSRLGESEVLKRLGEVAAELTSELTVNLRSRYKDNADIQKHTFLFNFGVSLPVVENNDDSRILADIQALQAAKMARRFGMREFLFNQEEFDKLMRQADDLRQELWQELGLAQDELPSENEMKEVRGKTEESLLAEINKGTEGAQKQLLLKKYLDIIDLFDYPKSWRADPARRLEEKETILRILEGLDNIIMKRGPPGSSDDVAVLQEALAVIKTNSKNHRLTSGEAFLANAAELLKKKRARIISVDVVGFWANIQTNLARAQQEYMESINADNAQKEKTVLRLSLEVDDLIKRKMADKLDALLEILGGYVPVVEFNGQQHLLINQEGGDEIVFYIHGQYNWNTLANELSSKDLGVRIMTVRVLRGDVPEQINQRLLGMVYTQITHGLFGEAYITSQQADKRVKALEAVGITSAVVSRDINEQHESEWFVYYRGQRESYDNFYARIKEKTFESSSREVLSAEKEKGYYSTVIDWVEYILSNYKTRFGGNKLIFIGGASKRAYETARFLSTGYGIEQRNVIYLDLPREVIRRTSDETIGTYLKQEGVFNNGNQMAIFDNWTDTGGTLERVAGVLKRGRPDAKIITYVMHDNGNVADSYARDVPDSRGEINLAAVFIGKSNWMQADARKQILVAYQQDNERVRPVYLSIADLRLFLLEVGSDVNIHQIEFNTLSSKSQEIFPLVRAWLELRGFSKNYSYSNKEVYQTYQELVSFCEANFANVADRQDTIFNTLLQNRAPVRQRAKTEDAAGGIDFRFLPIVIQSADNLKASIKLIPINNLQRVNLTREWLDIERLVESGITPSAERLKEYFAASYVDGSLDGDMNKIISCISDILRMEEQDCSLTDPILKDILVVLGSGRNAEELKLVFAN